MMSYPGRPPVVPSNMPVQPGMPYVPLGAAQPLIPSIVPMTQMMTTGATMVSAPMQPYRNITTRNKKQTKSSSSRTTISAEPDIHIPPEPPTGPPVTVFVGNITEKAPDIMIRHILAACGHVSTWKRVQAFGFCEFGSPDAALRAIRLLHEMEIGGKKLVAKVDAKTKTVLDEYKGERKKKENGTQENNKGGTDDDYCDEEVRKHDQAVKKKIQEILLEYKDEMQKYIPQNEEDKPKTGAEVTEARLQQTQQRLLQLSRTSDASANHHVKIDLDTVDFVDEGKRDLISREIGKFREIMKRQEEEKEVERKRREEREREKEKIRSPIRNERNERSAVTPESVYSVSSVKSVSPEVMRHNRHRASRNSRSKSRTREKERERDRDNRDRVRDRGDRERGDRDRGDRDRERERDREEAPKDRDMTRDKELEEELNEKKKQERIAREKEAAYQERLRGWETRERHKVKEAIKEKEKKRIKEEERKKEAKRLKEFLEDYDDERDDSKYYKGRELQKRLADREREIEMDNRDRQKEIDEIEDLKSKILASESNDPEIEIAKMLKAREDMYRPRLIIDVTEETKKELQKKKEKEKGRKSREQEVEKKDKNERRFSETENKVELMNSRKQLVPYNRSVSPSPPPDNPSPMDEFSLTPEQGLTPPFIPPAVSTMAPQPVPNPIQIIISNEKQALLNDKKKKKKLDVRDVFNDEEDEESGVVNKKRKLVPLDYNDEKKGKEDGPKSQEEKKKHIKSLIEKIPTDKTNLFLYQLDWSSVDSPFIEKRIRPWINKKIIEYIGEPEPTLVDFICSKVLAGSQPQSILDDVQMVLDEEAEVFVVKMWRLLIYEVEAKKLGLLTTTKNNNN